MQNERFTSFEPIVSTKTDRMSYLQDVAIQSLERIDKNCREFIGLDEVYRISQNLVDFTMNLDRGVVDFDQETNQQRTRRLGWIIQIEAIRAIQKNNNIPEAIKATLKNAIVLDILKARQDEGGHLPGVVVKFREPFKNDRLDNEGELDEFSNNAVAVEVAAVRGDKLRRYYGITTRFGLLAQKEGIKPARQLLGEYQALQEEPGIWVADLMRELSLYFPGKDQQRIMPVEAKDKRFALLKVLTDKYKWLLDYFDVRDNKYPSTGHVLTVSVLKDPDHPESTLTVLHIHPKQVTDQQWDIICWLADDPESIPERRDCMPRGKTESEEADFY